MDRSLPSTSKGNPRFERIFRDPGVFFLSGGGKKTTLELTERGVGQTLKRKYNKEKYFFENLDSTKFSDGERGFAKDEL